MKVILVRSSTMDSAVFKVVDTLYKNGFEVELLVWDRLNTLNKINYPYKIHKFNLKAPHDSYWVFFYLPIWWIYEFTFLVRNNYELIHACDLDTLWPAIFANFFKKTKFFYTIYDFYADNIPKLPKLIRKALAFLEKGGIRFSDVLFLVDEGRYEQIKGSKIKKLVYIYNSPIDLYHNKKLQNFHNNELVIFYAGSLNKFRGLNYIIDAIKELKSIQLVIAGICNDEYIVKAANTNKNITYLGWLDHNDVLEMSIQADVLFAFYDPSVPNNKYASPNKLFDAMMCSKPIIINSKLSASQIVKSENCGLVVEYGDVQSIKKAIITLRDNPDLREDLGKNGRHAYETKYSWKIMEKRLLKAYKMCGNNK